MLDGEPSVGTEFQWINGQSTHRKTMRWSAHPLAAGNAAVGPMPLTAEGQHIVLPAIPIAVANEEQIRGGTPADTLRALLAAGREPLFVTAETDRSTVYAGEEVFLTWYLYTAESLRGFVPRKQPKLADFWVEEIPANEEASQELMIDGRQVERVPVRRVALFPLHSGRVTVEPMEVVAEALEPSDEPFGFGMFEGRVTQLRRMSPTVTFDVTPLPGNYDAVGHFNLECAPPSVSPTGNVAFDVTVEGAGNLRGAPAPHFEGTVAGDVEIEDAGVKVTRAPAEVRMRRTWRYVIFPARQGRLAIPPLTFSVFDPATTIGSQLRCAGTSVEVKVVPQKKESPKQTAAQARTTAVSWVRAHAVAIVAVLFALIALVVLIDRRARRHFDESLHRDLMSTADDPAEMRRRLHHVVTARRLSKEQLFRDPSELGERFRALSSLIDLLEKEPWERETSRRDLERRTADFVSELERTSSVR